MAEFTIIPAVDLRGGKCVRLRQGLADAETVYSEDPVRMAVFWEQQGAKWLHVVDLDGAFLGEPVQTNLVRKMIKAVKIPVQVGGGLRTERQIQSLIDAGAARIILGTRACRNPAGVAQLVASFGDQLAVGIDARKGFVQVKGWTESTTIDAVLLAERMASLGVRTLIYTDTALDGMRQGPNVAMVRLVCSRVAARIIASGGVASVAHVRALRSLGRDNLIGAIVGKALYDKIVTLPELQAPDQPPVAAPAGGAPVKSRKAGRPNAS